MVSYAQNFEDVMLWRALQHIEKGFYIDVGANDPDEYSVTKAFYDKGWRGINVEPVSQWFKRLEEYRARDINLQVAVGNAACIMTLYELPDTGLSTMDLAIAEMHEKEGGHKKIVREVQVETLTKICQAYHEAPVHFLKVDVEGAEKEVLEGLDLKKIRPWIILVESTLPSTQIESYDAWEDKLLESGYSFVYFDGLNRYYLASEHQELAKYFKAPPNVFDEFIIQQHLNCQSLAQSAEARVKQLETDLKQAESIQFQLETDLKQVESDLSQSKCTSAKLVVEVSIAKEENDTLRRQNQDGHISANQIEEELKAVYASKSWRIMLQLRKIMHLIIRLPRKIKQLANVSSVSVMRFVIAQPILKKTALILLSKFPSVKAHFNAMALRAGLSTKQGYRGNAGEPVALHKNRAAQNARGALPLLNVTRHDEEILQVTPRASRIYAELNACKALNEQENY